MLTETKGRKAQPEKIRPHIHKLQFLQKWRILMVILFDFSLQKSLKYRGFSVSPTKTIGEEKETPIFHRLLKHR